MKKAHSSQEAFRKEALLLKRLRHPGIPIVYDLEEDAEFYYLIEEFLEGDSFYDLVKKQGHLSQFAVIRYGIQICELIDYLHSAEELPILYLDLQPRNLLLCHEQVKLLDFDHADSLKKANQTALRFGTPGFAAPEQKGSDRLGVFTDVYQLGALLAFLVSGRVWDGDEARISGDAFGRFLKRCLRETPSERYLSMKEVREELSRLHGQAAVSANTPSLTVAFVGTRPGAGVTHLALGFLAYLTGRGIPCLYEEQNSSGDVRNMARYFKAQADAWGIFSLRGFPLKPWYGPAVRLLPHGYPVTVRDYGTSWQLVAEAEDLAFVYLVAGGKWWEQEAAERAGIRLQSLTVPTRLIYDHGGRRILSCGFMGMERRNFCFLAPCFPDPFCLGPEETAFYGALTDGVIPEEALKRELPEKNRKTKRACRRRMPVSHGYRRRIRKRRTQGTGPRLIGVAGAGQGAGVTHTAVVLAGVLRSGEGRRTALLEWNKSGAFAAMGKSCQKEMSGTKHFCIQGVDVYPAAGSEVLAACLKAGYDDILIDFGSRWQEALAELLRCQRVFFLVSFCEWKEGVFGDTEDWEGTVRENGWVCLSAFGSEEARENWNKRRKPSVSRIPFSADAFAVTKEMIDFFGVFL